jgi:site-specific recombinase
VVGVVTLIARERAEVAPEELPDGELRNRRVRDLVSLLERLADSPSLDRRLDALERLARWVTAPDQVIPLGPGAGPVEPPWRRLEALLGALARLPVVRGRVRAALGAVVAETTALGLLAETGLPNDRGVGRETADRLFRRLLPAPRDEHDLARLLLRLFPSPRELRWIERMPAELFHRLVEALTGDALAPLAEATAEALSLVAGRVQALGLSQAIRARSQPGPVRASPFFALPRRGDELLAQLEAPVGRLAAERVFRLAIEGCREAATTVLGRLEASGVSIDVVYGLDVIEQSLRRLERLAAVLVTAPGRPRSAAVQDLLATLVWGRQADRSLRILLRTNLHLLARKIIDRAGQTGEHYITSTRRDYAGMLLSAAGGGLLTTGTALVKVAVTVGHFAPFVEGFLSSANFALSFVLMQLLGLTLATKQPSMTAATLAGSIRATGEAGQLDELVTQVARICRSQLAAALGNVSAVTVGALALDRWWRWRFGHPVISAEKASSVFASLHPLHSGTVFFAALTGVILWLSSVAAGSIENFAVYHRLPQAIAEHWSARLLSARFTRAAAGWFARHVSGLGGSLALGAMLGMTPVVGKFLGLPLDVRHVTLSTGTLVLAGSAVGQGALPSSAALAAAGGIAIIFAANLGVSFTLALAVALRARAVPLRDSLRLGGALVRHLLRRPGDFVLPPRR